MSLGESSERTALIVDRFSARDIPHGLDLVAQVGWNQTAADWAAMLEIGEGWAIRNREGRPLATVVVTRYAPNTGWISMMIVDRDHRGRGMASQLLAHAVRRLEATGHLPMLDATPVGRAVYERAGFRSFAALVRWRGPGGARTQARQAATVTSGQSTGLARAAFGYDNARVLDGIVARGWCWSMETGTAYAWARPGRVATHLGALVAGNEDDAMDLCDRALDELAGTVIADVPEGQSRMADLLSSRGFVAERGFHRMAKLAVGADDPTLNEYLRITAGPEFG